MGRLQKLLMPERREGSSTAAIADMPGLEACIVCSGHDLRSHLPGLARCHACGMVSAESDISDADVEQLYGADYFHGSEYLDYIAEQESLRLNFRHRIRTLRQIVPDLAARDLFEIGCAYGFFLDEVRSSVRSASGIDISLDATRYARDVLNVAAVQGDYLAFDAPNRFGIATMWDTVEHLKRPDLTSDDAYADGTLPFLAKRGLVNVDRDKLIAALPLIRERAQSWDDAAAALDYVFREPPVYDEKAVRKFLTTDATSRLADFRGLLAKTEPFDAPTIERDATAWLSRENLQLKDVAQAARVALTGRSASPPLFDVAALLGKERCLARLDRALETAQR